MKPQVFGKQRKSMQDMAHQPETKFLEKAAQVANFNNNPASRSTGRENKVGLNNKIKLWDPQYESDFSSKVKANAELIKRTHASKVYSNEPAGRRSVRNPQVFSKQFVTMDTRPELNSIYTEPVLKKADNTFDIRMKMYSSVQGVNLPKINNRGSEDQLPVLRNSISTYSKLTCKYF